MRPSGERVRTRRVVYDTEDAFRRDRMKLLEKGWVVEAKEWKDLRPDPVSTAPNGTGGGIGTIVFELLWAAIEGLLSHVWRKSYPERQLEVIYVRPARG